ncbi:MAG: hypothetical protein KKE50_05850, partial [Nanoarchaeota archaeon]|nr:hypothetical protein [Nanoarchaeota archaeon]
KNKDKKKIELVDVKKVLREKNRIKQKSKQGIENQINESQNKETKKIPRLTLLQKKITKDLDNGKTAEEIAKDFGISLEKVKEELNNLQDLNVITAQEQKIYLTK